MNRLLCFLLTGLYSYIGYWLPRPFGPVIIALFSLPSCSGLTRVGDTRGGNWGCHPSIFFLKKTWRPFSARRCHYHYRFLLLSLGCHPSRGCHPTPFLPVRPRFSTILCKFTHKIFVPSGVTPWRVSPGAVRPPCDSTTVLSSKLNSVSNVMSSLARCARSVTQFYFSIWPLRAISFFSGAETASFDWFIPSVNASSMICSVFWLLSVRDFHTGRRQKLCHLGLNKSHSISAPYINLCICGMM